MKKISFIQKLITCLIGGLICGQAFLKSSDFVLGKVVPPILLVISAASIIIGAIVYIGIWQWRDKKGIANNARIKTFWTGAIRYAVAFDLTLFGFRQMFHMQAFVPLGMLDEPFSSISGYWLTWSYFGRSYGFMFTIGILQILGALLLVFNRTRLMGVMILTPIVLAIVLINYFYGLELGDLLHTVILMVGLLYLLALDYKRIVEFFSAFTETDLSFQTKHIFIKHVGRVSIIFIPLLLIALKPSPDKHPELTGKYKVTDMNINGEHKLATSACDSLLTVVYFDIANDCAFEFNGVPRRMYGSYTLDAAGTLKTQWHYPPAAKEKQFSGTLKRITADEIELIGYFQQDSIQVKLKKQH